jgi:ribosomal protein S18 acetylase RimI-like enzyme
MILIRPAREGDGTAFHALLDAVARERRFLAALEAPSLERMQEFVDNNAKKGLPQFFAFDGDQLVGWCDAIPGDVSGGSPHVSRLGMGVAKTHRGRGIGRQLMEVTIARCRELGLEKIELGVYSSNEPAIALYRKLGFRDEGRRIRSRLVDGIYDDVIAMGLFLRLGALSLTRRFAAVRANRPSKIQLRVRDNAPYLP